jgi:hypothetical protein
MFSLDYWDGFRGAQAEFFFGLFTCSPEYLYYARDLLITLNCIIFKLVLSSEIAGGFVIDYKKDWGNTALESLCREFDLRNIRFTVSYLFSS